MESPERLLRFDVPNAPKLVGLELHLLQIARPKL